MTGRHRLPWTSRVTLISQALRHQSRPTHTLPVRRALHRFRPHLAPITIRVDRSDVFVTKINATGTALVYSVLMGGSGFEWLVGLFVDGDGSAYFAGYGTPDFPLTPGAFDSGYSGGFAGKQSADGSQLLYSTHLGGVRLNDAELAWVDSLGRAVVIGSSMNPRFPTTPDSLIPCFPERDPSYYPPWPFVTKFNASGTALVYSSFLRRRPVAHDSSGNLYLPSDTAILERVNISTPLPPGPRCVTNAASFWGTAVSPGEIVSLFGPSIGPDTPATLELDDAGRVSSRLSEIRVLFNAMPAPLLYVSKNQINAVVPFGVAGLSQVSIQRSKGTARRICHACTPRSWSPHPESSRDLRALSPSIKTARSTLRSIQPRGTPLCRYS